MMRGKMHMTDKIKKQKQKQRTVILDKSTINTSDKHEISVTKSKLLNSDVSK